METDEGEEVNSLALNHTITAERSEPSPPQEKHHVTGRNNASRSLHCRGVILGFWHCSCTSVWSSSMSGMPCILAGHLHMQWTVKCCHIYLCLVTSLLNLMNNNKNNNKYKKRNTINKL